MKRTLKYLRFLIKYFFHQIWKYKKYKEMEKRKKEVMIKHKNKIIAMNTKMSKMNRTDRKITDIPELKPLVDNEIQ